MSYSFTGSGIDFLTTMAGNRGGVDVFVDTVKVRSDSCFAAVSLDQQVCSSIRGLAFGGHTLKVVKTGGFYLSLDALRVW